MPQVSLSGLALVAVVAFAVPLLLGALPSLRLPGAVLEIVAGIVLGPSVLGWVRVDVPLGVLSLIGLAFLLFLAGLEIDVQQLRGSLDGPCLGAAVQGGRLAKQPRAQHKPRRVFYLLGDTEGTVQGRLLGWGHTFNLQA